MRGLAHAAVFTAVLLGGCSTSSRDTSSQSPASPLVPDGITDNRSRFREIFCAVLDAHGEALPDSRPCGEALDRFGDEPDATGRPVELGTSLRRLTAVVVPGVGWDCIADWLDPRGTAVAHVRRSEYGVTSIDVESLSSCSTNARIIRDVVTAMEPTAERPDLVLVGYSKGAPDILEAVVAYPELWPRIAAVVSVAGAVGGSPIADHVTQAELEVLKGWPGAQCSSGDRGALDSLRPATREAWLTEHRLPDELAYYTLVTLPRPDNISSALRPFYRKLSRIDPFNDGMVLYPDQFIPGSTLLGYLNADHWAVAVPIARSHSVVGSTVVDHNDYPREALLEALLRFVEEDLSTSRGGGQPE